VPCVIESAREISAAQANNAQQERYKEMNSNKKSRDDRTLIKFHQHAEKGDLQGYFDWLERQQRYNTAALTTKEQAYIREEGRCKNE